MRNAVAKPLRDVLRRRIQSLQDIVDDMVVELVHDLLDLGEIHDHAIVVERVILHRDRNDPVVSMEIRTLAFIVQVQEMRTGYFDSFRYCKLRLSSLYK